jgi:hypothetical protein
MGRTHCKALNDHKCHKGKTIMKKLLLSFIFVSVLLTSQATPPASAAPGGPTRPTPLPCSWNGQLYAHGSYRSAAVIGINGQLLHYDVYQCQNGQWIYRYSSDDKP